MRWEAFSFQEGVVIHVNVDTARLERRLQAIAGEQVPFATAVALNEIAFKIKRETGPAEMRKVFDRPSPWTLRSLFVVRASKSRLVARVGWGQDYYSKSRLTPDETLGQQVSGGPRREKGMEHWLRQAGMLGGGEFIVPGSGARLDRYGNMARGQTVQIMSQLRLGLDPYMWSTGSKRSNRSVTRAGRIFWSRGDRIPRGAWLVTGKSIKPLLVVVSSTNYQPRFNIRNVVESTTDADFPAAFRKALRMAISTRR